MAKKQKKSVIERVESVLRSGRGLTGLAALTRFNTTRLAAYIHLLRRQGMRIKTDMITTKSGKIIARYRWLPDGIVA